MAWNYTMSIHLYIYITYISFVSHFVIKHDLDKQLKLDEWKDKLKINQVS